MCFTNTGSAAIHLNVIKPMVTPSVHLMNFHLLTPNGENYRIPLLEPHNLWDNEKFNRNWNTTLVVTGWNTNINSTNECVDSLFAGYKHRNINFVVICNFHVDLPFEFCILNYIFCMCRFLIHLISLIRCTAGLHSILKLSGKLLVQPWPS